MAKITLGQWEGEPTALVQQDDGSAEGYLYAGEWKPGYVDEAMTKATILDEAAFKKAFPDVPPFKPAQS